MGFRDRAWVTSVLSDEDVPKALVLRYSLDRVFSMYKIAVIVSPRVSINLRSALEHGFDFLFELKEERSAANVKLEDFAKMYSMAALSAFETCAYLSPSMIIVKNCDDIFAAKTDGFRTLEDFKDTSVFLFRPSVKGFECMMAGLKDVTDNDFCLGSYINSYARHQDTPTGTLDRKYFNMMAAGDLNVGCEHDISIINLDPYPVETNAELWRNAGTLGKHVANLWLKIQQEDALPLIRSCDGGLRGMAEVAEGSHNLSRYNKEAIAIVGMSCRYPGSNNLEEFWDLLFQGRDATGTPPSFRWLREQCSKYLPDARSRNAGFLKVPVDEFDARFFGISPKEVTNMDPQHRLLLELVWEGLEDACIDPHALRGTSGSVFTGSYLNEYKEILLQSGNTNFYRDYMGNSIGAAAARISFLLGMTGPSISTESGCSSALVAVHLACRSLRLGETNLALACGVNLILNPFNKDDMGAAFSPDGRSKTFSEDANGFGRAEGGGVLVLKRLSDAVRDEDKIWGVIRGSAICQEGLSQSLGTPTVHCETLAMMDALRDANVLPEEISYVEAHGTGTVVGDPVEISAITKAYNSPNRKKPLIIGSVKTNVGHTESCAGITGIMKVVLAMHHEVIPAHINCPKLNPVLDLGAIPAIIPFKRIDWRREEGKPRIAGISSHGITGTDGHMIVQEPPQLSGLHHFSTGHDYDRTLHIMKVSAKTEKALHILLGNFKNAVARSEYSTSDIAYSANIGRADFPYRAAVIGRTNDDIVDMIEQRKYWKGDGNTASVEKICFLFTGQGSQYPEMAKQLYSASHVFKIHFDYCAKILKDKYNMDIVKIMWTGDRNSGGQISRTIYSQTGIFCVEYALLKLWESWGVKPDYVLGHSLGEFAAAVCAGILSVQNAITLVAERSSLIDELPEGKMLVIKADYQRVEKTLAEFSGGRRNKILDYAAINSSEQTVVAGDTNMIASFALFCRNNGMKCLILDATHAFHSNHMDPILDKYRAVAKNVYSPNEHKCEYISGLKGDLCSAKHMNADYWVHHTRDPVRFLDASKKAVELGCNIFVEIGPQPVLSSLTMLNNDDDLLCVPSLKRNENDWTTILTSLAKLYTRGVTLDWNGFYRYLSLRKVRLPSYPFLGRKFWPELLNKNEKTIHPLIGSIIPNASSTKIFQCGVNLKNLEYIGDHVFGNNVVCPGACFLEMCLAGGLGSLHGALDSLSKPGRPLMLKNMTISSPLILEESKTVQVQTVVQSRNNKDPKNAGIETEVNIYHRVDGDLNVSWVKHANATFFPLTSEAEKMDSIDPVQLHKMISDPANGETSARLYERLAGAGYKFGKQMRSIKDIWVDEQHSLLAKIKIPSEDAQYGNYILHPIIIDAMIQAMLVLKFNTDGKVTFCVPIRIGKFLWISEISPEATSDMFIHVKDGTAFLFDSCGKLLAVMSDVEFVETTVRVLESLVEQQTKSMPDLWEEIWRPTSSSAQYGGSTGITTIGLESRQLMRSNGTKTWLIFHNKPNNVCNYLAKSFAQLPDTRKVISASPGPHFGNSTDNCFTIRPDSEHDLIQLMETVARDPDMIEGIIFAWALDETAQSNILRPYFFILKYLLNLKSETRPRLYLLTKGAVNTEDHDISNFHSSTLWGFTKSLSNEDVGLFCKCIDIGEATMEDDLLKIFHELWNPERQVQVALRGSGRYVPKLVPHKVSYGNLKLPAGVDRFKLILPESKAVSDLTFGPLDHISLGSLEVEIQVKAYALNFRDVFCILKPTDQFGQLNTVGMDFSGIVKRVGNKVCKWSVGQYVYGIKLDNSTLPSHINLHQDSICSMPNDMTFGEASTLPVVMATVIYSLIDVCNITSSDTVLIHSASGGVGLAAIQLCKHIGANIICTAGSKRKRNYLKSLGIQHVFNSRNTEYETEILKVTAKRGVDVVLNSLTSDGFKEATLNVCARRARFVEMSKLSIWKPEEVEKVRPDVKYAVVDLMELSRAELNRLMSTLVELTEVNDIRPIPYTRFDAANIQEALQHMQKAKHIGKVVCIMPEFETKDGSVASHTSLFNTNATYLITGGIGGIGFEICKWMVNGGARYVLLAGRSLPNPTMKEKIANLNIVFNAKVHAVQVDVSSIEQCMILIQNKIPELQFPELRGIMHCAGALSDALIQNQTWESISSSFSSKVTGTIILHELTKHNTRLEHFVLFSSITALFGTPGQSNYSAANCFEDAFAHYRRSIGLPATSINWGQWGEVGMAAELDLLGVKPFSTQQGISALEYALKTQQTHICVMGVESYDRLSQLCPIIKTYMDDCKPNTGTGKAASGFDDFWQRFEDVATKEEKMNLLKESVQTILRHILRLNDPDTIEDNISFQELGVDSLMFVEIKNSLQSLVGDRLTIKTNLVRDSNTVSQLVQATLNAIAGNGVRAAELTDEEIYQLIQEDCRLPEHIVPQSNVGMGLKDISHVLVTGVTGILGPYILAELSHIPQIKQITCLVRPKKNFTAEKRLETILTEMGLLTKVDTSKVCCITGNIALPNLGVELLKYQHLCNEVDAVFNCAASVQHLEKYRKENSFNSARSVNVMGLKHILEFCCTGAKLKHIYHASTVLAVATVDSTGNFAENWPNVDDFFGVTTYAYPITKFIGDILMKEAVTNRGVPGKVFRLPLISADSKTGRFAMEKNHFMLRYLFGLQKGIIADSSFPLVMLPVDVCAQVSVYLFFNPEVPNDILNITNCKADTDMGFAVVAKQLGYKMDIVDVAEFSKSIRESVEEDSPMAALKEFYTGDKELMWFNASNVVLQEWSKNGKNRNDFFVSKKLIKFLPEFYRTGFGSRSTMEFIFNDFMFAKKNGSLKKFDL